MNPLKNELIGAWRLLSFIEIPVSGGDSCFPLGKSPKGILIYGPNGFMSLQISASEELRTEADKKSMDFMGFSGKYTVDNHHGCVNYFIETSSSLHQENTRHVKKIDFEGDVLYQKSIEPISSNGQLIHAYMTWKRIEKENDDDMLQTEQLVHFEV